MDVTRFDSFQSGEGKNKIPSPPPARKETQYELFKPGDPLTAEGDIYVGSLKHHLKYQEGRIVVSNDELKNYLVQKGHILLNEKEVTK